MSEQRPPMDQDSLREDKLDALIRRAGPRPTVDPMVRARIERATRAAWQRQLERRPPTARRWALAAAAACAMVAGTWWLTRHAGLVEPVLVARVERVTGAAWGVSGADRVPVRAGQDLPAGLVLDLAPGATMALRSRSGGELRVGPSSDLRLLGDGRVELSAGAVYIDNHGSAQSWEVRTDLLQATDIGTRFLVTHGRTGSAVAVRDGWVRIAHAGEVELGAGEKFQVLPGGESIRDKDAGHGAEWSWVVDAALPPDLRDRPVIEFLRWYAHESGMQLRIEQDSGLVARLNAPLQGSTTQLGARQWLDVAQLAAEFVLTSDPALGVIHVKSAL